MSETVPLHEDMDAQRWAREFFDAYKESPGAVFDEGWLTGWFANAIMVGYDTAMKRADVKQRELVGYLTAAIPELHRVEMGRMIEALDAFNASE